MNFQNVESSRISFTVIGKTSLILTCHSWKIHSLLKAETHYYQQHRVCLITPMFESYTRVIMYLCFLSQIHSSLHLSIQLFFEVFILCHELLNLILFEEKCTDLKMFETGMSCQLLVTVLQIVCPLIPSVLLWESAFPSHGTVWVLRKSRQSRIYQSMRGNIVIFKNWSNKCNIYTRFMRSLQRHDVLSTVHTLCLSINTTPKPNTHNLV